MAAGVGNVGLLRAWHRTDTRSGLVRFLGLKQGFVRRVL
jgi:hypothetical protein